MLDVLLLFFGFLFILLGIVGSFLPIIPGPIMGWAGILLLYFTSVKPVSVDFLKISFIVSLAIFLLDNVLSIAGTKKFGGSLNGVIGSAIGLMVGLFLGPAGIIIGPFIGAFLGELTVNKRRFQIALRAAVGTLIGFLAGVFIKLLVGVIFLYYFLKIIWTNRELFFKM